MDAQALQAEQATTTLWERYRRIRAVTEAICAPLEIEDYVVQTMTDVSPPKWHLAHTTWFFETFVLKPYLSHYRLFHRDYGFLFNSYYESVGSRHPRAQRGLLSRPTVKEVATYRHYVDEAMGELLLMEATNDECRERIVLGLHHEQQHQELLFTDLKHILATNPLRPAYSSSPFPVPSERRARSAPSSLWTRMPAAMVPLGNEGDDFAFDNEEPSHETFVQEFEIANRLVTNGDYLKFMEDGGYRNPALWLSEGWTQLNAQGWQAPLYWEMKEGHWHVATLSGLLPVNEAEPVAHVSYFEADAYARWAQARLATEAEWETVARRLPIQGNFMESGRYHPAPASGATGPEQMFGDVWEWTQSAYLPYPGFAPRPGAVGEYNGKFMCNQFVLRGGSCVTPRSHIRPTYRNFFAPGARWQFSGIRLARTPSKGETHAR